MAAKLVLVFPILMFRRDTVERLLGNGATFTRYSNLLRGDMCLPVTE